jgi:hypothetical protein
VDCPAGAACDGSTVREITIKSDKAVIEDVPGAQTELYGVWSRIRDYGNLIGPEELERCADSRPPLPRSVTVQNEPGRLGRFEEYERRGIDTEDLRRLERRD